MILKFDVKKCLLIFPRTPTFLFTLIKYNFLDQLFEHLSPHKHYSITPKGLTEVIQIFVPLILILSMERDFQFILYH